MRKVAIGWLGTLYLLASALTASAAQLTICSFNVQWIGNSSLRMDFALAEAVKGFDIVVVQELVSPPFPGTYPDGTPFKPDAESAEFFDAMQARGFTFQMSEEKTGKNPDKIHKNGSATEFYVTFFKAGAVKLANDLPHGFIDPVHGGNPDFDRVP